MNAINERASNVRPEGRREPTEVHVHIGRIEVIAAPEPAAPNKQHKSPQRSTLPLADYLAKKARP
jgi:hypothetical protein